MIPPTSQRKGWTDLLTKWFPVCLTLALLSGCSSVGTEKAVRLFEPFRCKRPVYVFCGRLERSWIEDQFGAAKYEMKTVSRAGSAIVIFDVLFYKATLTAPLPTNALLAMVRRDRGAFELLGRDANRSIASDTPENRRIWEAMYSQGGFLPPRRAWMSKRAAVALAQRALAIGEEDRVAFVFKPRRYELGWFVWVEPRGDETPIGAHAEVVVGDDGNVKFLCRGL
jgi:hypothetical protein